MQCQEGAMDEGELILWDLGRSQRLKLRLDA